MASGEKSSTNSIACGGAFGFRANSVQGLPDCGPVPLVLFLRILPRRFPRIQIIDEGAYLSFPLPPPLFFDAISGRQCQAVHRCLALPALGYADKQPGQRPAATTGQFHVPVRLNSECSGGQHGLSADGRRGLCPHLDCLGWIPECTKRMHREGGRRW